MCLSQSAHSSINRILALLLLTLFVGGRVNTSVPFLSWNPSIGTKLLEMFELVHNHKNDIWFAHFVEIVQYLWNKKYTSINLISEIKNQIIFELKSFNVMRNYPITISFSKQININKITVEDVKQTIYTSTDNEKYYIKFKPKDNYTHKIKVFYN